MNILFCNIGWSKEYHGSDDDDVLIGGGSYVDTNKDGGEAYNFCHFNRNYYGYVYPNGDISIERIGNVSKKSPYIKDVLVVWMATKPKETGTYIIGWYKQATVYREMQYYNAREYGENYAYHAICSVDNGLLLPVQERTFLVPNAIEAGKGKGKGRSNIWYADSLYAQNEIIPKVLEYIEGYMGESADRIYTKEELTFKTNTMLPSATIYFDAAKKYIDQGQFYTALTYFNAAKAMESTADISIAIGELLIDMGYIDEAKAEYEQKIADGEQNCTIEINYCLARIYMLLSIWERALEKYDWLQKELRKFTGELLDPFDQNGMILDSLLLASFCCDELGLRLKAKSYDNIALQYTDDEDLKDAIMERLSEVDEQQ